MREWTLFPISTALRSLALPLVHNAPDSGALFGQPLAPGLYELAVELAFLGPEHPGSPIGPGLPVRASLGVQIE
ncbi:MAG: hypothetical protein ABL998_13675 [Planctomycetota bacterium]